MKAITLEEYAKLIGYEGKELTLGAIQDFAENELDWTIWDYPIEEENYVKTEVQSDYVFVDTGAEIRICEC
jgi:hypothetical protein